MFRVQRNSSGERFVEYLNKRTGGTEVISVPRLVIYLLEAEMANDNDSSMLYSPQKRIPLGILLRDQYGIYFMEVKYKKNKERIRFTTYVSLLLESEAMKCQYK